MLVFLFLYKKILCAILLCIFIKQHGLVLVMKIGKFVNFYCGSTLLTVLCLLVFTTVSISTEAYISPPRIKIEAKPREQVQFNLEVRNKNSSPRSYIVSYSYYMQDENGYQKEIRLDHTKTEGLWDWITLDSGEKFKLDAKETLPIKGILKIPSKKSHGFHNTLITVTEITPQKKTGVTLNYATGSLVELTVIGPKKRPKTAIMNPEIRINDGSDENFIHLDFLNKSAYKGRLFLEVHLRHNKRLISKTVLLSDQSHKSNMPYSLVFPKNRINLRGKITKALEPGDYEIRVAGKFNGIRLQTSNHKLRVDDSGQSIVEDVTTETANTLLKKDA